MPSSHPIFQHARHHKRTGSRKLPYMLLLCICCVASYYLGMVSNWITSQEDQTASHSAVLSADKMSVQIEKLNDEIKRLKSARIETPARSCPECAVCSKCPTCPTTTATTGNTGTDTAASPTSSAKPLAGSWVSQGVVSTDSLIDGDIGFSLGIPPFYMQTAKQKIDSALVLHHRAPKSASISNPNSLDDCEEVDVVVTKRDSPGHCLVVMEHYQSYTLHRYMRLNRNAEKGGDNKASLDKNFEKVGRGRSTDGSDQFKSPDIATQKKHWKHLVQYFESFEEVSAELDAKLKKIVDVNNDVIVMVANAGVIELLANFVCSARSRNLDISNIIVFATDDMSREVVDGLGLTSFDGSRSFPAPPEEEARAYGDQTFQKMMYVKVVSVHMALSLGYNVLFQDVDITWQEHPLAWLRNNQATSGDDFDAYFEDDGARSLRYAPWSANSGFYYLKFNRRTSYLMTNLLYESDNILVSHSHQQALSSVLNDHSSQYGLSLKVLSREQFTGGKSFHHDSPFMLSWMKGEVSPVIFHMCWTLNKDDKLKYMQQMGEWFLKEGADNEYVREMGEKAGEVCSLEPVITCHFSDKPSAEVAKCSDSPRKDKNGKIFWN